MIRLKGGRVIDPQSGRDGVGDVWIDGDRIVDPPSGGAAETYDLTNIGTLFAFALVCIGVLVLRYTEPDRPRPFRVPFAWPVCLLGAGACVFIMVGLPAHAWVRFGWWLALGLAIYFLYGKRHSHLRASA